MFFLFLITIAIIVVVSLYTTKPQEKQLEGLTYGSATPEQIAETRASWNTWDVVHTVVIVGIIITFYGYFW